MKNIEVSLDLGFGDSKVVYSIGSDLSCFKFPTAITFADSHVSYLEGIAREREYEYQGKRYLVGKDAVGAAFSTQRYGFISDYGPIFAFHALEQVLDRVGGGNIPSLYMGLPLSYYDRGRVELKPLFDCIEVNGKVFNLDSQFFPQGVGILADLRVTEEGTFRFGTDVNMLVCDVGFNTIDICVINHGQVSKKGTMTIEKQGIMRMAESIQKIIRAEHSVALTDPEAVAVIHSGKCISYGVTLNCSEYVLEVTKNYAEWLFNELAAKHEDHIHRSQKIVLGGGGAYLLRGHIPQRYRVMTHVPEKPEFANARGYLKIMQIARASAPAAEAV